MRKIVLDVGFSPGDIVVFTRAVRDLCEQYPDYEVEIKSPCPAIFEANPFVNKREALDTPEIVPNADNLHEAGYGIHKIATAYGKIFKDLVDNNKLTANFVKSKKIWNYKFKGSRKVLFYCKQTERPKTDEEIFQIHYEDIHNSGASGRHFSNAFFIELEELLKVPIRQTSLLPDLHLSDEEKGWISQVEQNFNYKGNFWLLNGGHKDDFPLKQWGFDYWQELVDLLKNKVQFVQVGENSPGHEHQALDGCINLVGDTDLRELIRLTYHADGAISHVSLLHHLMAGWQKPCVTIAGGREPRRWEMYPHNRYMDTNGLLPCCNSDGCWKSGKIEPKENKKCINTVGNWSKCMRMITPEMVANEVCNLVDNNMPLHSKINMKIKELKKDKKNKDLAKCLEGLRKKL